MRDHSKCQYTSIRTVNTAGNSHLLTKRRAAKSSIESLCHCEVAAVGERSLNKLLLDSEVLKAVVELGVCHVDTQLLQDVGVLWVKVETHLSEPVKRLGVGHAILHQHASHVPLMYQLRNLYHHRTAVSMTCAVSTMSVYIAHHHRVSTALDASVYSYYNQVCLNVPIENASERN